MMMMMILMTVIKDDCDDDLDVDNRDAKVGNAGQCSPDKGNLCTGCRHNFVMVAFFLSFQLVYCYCCIFSIMVNFVKIKIITKIEFLCTGCF